MRQQQQLQADGVKFAVHGRKTILRRPELSCIVRYAAAVVTIISTRFEFLLIRAIAHPANRKTAEYF